MSALAHPLCSANRLAGRRRQPAPYGTNSNRFTSSDGVLMILIVLYEVLVNDAKFINIYVHTWCTQFPPRRFQKLMFYLRENLETWTVGAKVHVSLFNLTVLHPSIC